MSRKGNNKLKIYVDGQQVKQVSQFTYLGSLISEDGYCMKEIRSRIEMVKKVFMEKKKLYAAETWTLTQIDRRRLEAFEMWIWRRIEKVSWLDKVTNNKFSGE